MKLFISLFFIAGGAWASSVTLEEFDQLKLAEVVGEIPQTVRTRTITPVTAPVQGIEVESFFPKEAGAFQVHCKSLYYGDSPYISKAQCQLTVDMHHPDLEVGYDEIKISLKDPALVSALYEVIPYGRPEKEMYSYGRDQATNFEGNYTNVFHYRFHCLKESCVIRLSHKKLIQD